MILKLIEGVAWSNQSLMFVTKLMYHKIKSRKISDRNNFQSLLPNPNCFDEREDPKYNLRSNIFGISIKVYYRNKDPKYNR